jgi:hypothetical protein
MSQYLATEFEKTVLLWILYLGDIGCIADVSEIITLSIIKGNKTAQRPMPVGYTVVSQMGSAAFLKRSREIEFLKGWGGGGVSGMTGKMGN